MAEAGERTDNQVQVAVATSMEQIIQASAVRAMCFVEERELPFSEIFDENDLLSTHFLMTAGSEPIGSSRVRWFKDLAWIERTAVRTRYRLGGRNLTRLLDFVFQHVAMKGYDRIHTIAEARYATLWQRSFGFRRVDGKSATKPGEEKVYYELVRALTVPPDALSPRSPMPRILRTEGAWDEAGPSFG